MTPINEEANDLQDLYIPILTPMFSCILTFYIYFLDRLEKGRKAEGLYFHRNYSFIELHLTSLSVNITDKLVK